MFILYDHRTSSLHQLVHVIKKRPVTTEQRVAIILLKIK
jgi:hypothetical protein